MKERSAELGNIEEIDRLLKLPPKALGDFAIYGYLKYKQEASLRKKILDPGEVTERRTVTQGLATEMHNPGQATVKQTTFQPRDQGSKMLTNVTHFLERASKVKNKEAEDKLKWEQRCNSPGPGFQKSQLIPANVPFCFLCRLYKRKIHFCSALDKYVNIDVRNLIMLEGN